MNERQRPGAGPDDIAIAIPGLPGTFDRQAFIARFGPVFEHSPWVAEQAWAARPFSGLRPLHQAMVEVVRTSAPTIQLALLRQHPELWGSAARDRPMTADSVTEQGRAGLLALSSADAARIDALNTAHQQKFGFPFIIAVMQNCREMIFAEFERRLALDAGSEFAACLEQVYVITGLRIERMRAEQGGPA